MELLTKNGVTYYYYLNTHGDTIGLSDDSGAVYAGAIGGAADWIIGGTLSRKYINNDLKFQVWISLVKIRTYMIY